MRRTFAIALVSMSSVSPGFDISTGGETLQITGHGFSSPAKVLIGGAPCTHVQVLSDSVIRCTAPPHPPGHVHVTLQTGTPPAPTASGMPAAPPVGMQVEEELSTLSVVSNFFFTYIQDLMIVPRDTGFPINSKVKIKATGGHPPYLYSLVAGEGALDANTGLFSTTKDPTEGIMEVRDALGHVARTGFMTYLPLKIFPPTRDATTGETFRISPMGGLPPYEFEHVSGAGTLHRSVATFTAPDVPGTDTIKIIDGAGNTATLTVLSEDFSYRAQKVAAGDSHSCVILQGKVECWGQNKTGELGIGAMTPTSPRPLRVLGLDRRIRSISAGAHHTCALSVDGELKCWGDNRYGQLGDGTKTNRSTPSSVLGLETGVRAVSAGGFHTCALTLANSILCWGRNDQGQLGNATRENSLVPVRVLDINEKMVQIASGRSHSCAIADGGVKCWGDNQAGQLGNATHNESTTPVQVISLTSGAADLGSGWANGCAVESGGVKCWGYDVMRPAAIGKKRENGVKGKNSQDANSSRYEDAVPRAVALLQHDVDRVSVSQFHNCALSMGKLYCWGYNYHGELGDPSLENHEVPIEVKGFPSTIDDIALGQSHSCALLVDQRVYCWGDNQSGQLGDGSFQRRIKPVQIKN